MNRFLHTNMKSILIGIMVSMASFLSPMVAIGQTDFWTDEGNYDPDWPSADDIDGNYYNIRNEEDLAAFAYLVNSKKNTFKDKTVRIYQTHIDLKDHYWVPIVEFKGTFDGMGHRCENVIIDVNQLNNNREKFITDIGFFGSNYGTIKNVSLQSMHIIGHDIDYDLNIGGIAVVNEEGAVIDNCIVFDDEEKLPPIQTSLVDITHKTTYPTNYSQIGGICYCNQRNALVKNCRNQKPIRCDYTKTEGIGGIAYYNYGIIENCSNTKEIYAQNGSAAGIASSGHNSVINCTNEGYIHGVWAYGITGASEKCTNCTNKGTIEATYDAIGICGENRGTCTNNTNSGRIIGTTAVGIVKENDGHTLKNCTNTGNIEGVEYAAGIVYSNHSVYYQNQKQAAAISVSQCINYGNVTAINNDGVATAGGICCAGELFDNCSNHGEVKAKVPMLYSAYAGGITARISVRSVEDECKVSYCYNTKSVSAEGGKDAQSAYEYIVVTGGIAGEVVKTATINSCFNLGNISSINHAINNSLGKRVCDAGGIAGLVDEGGIITDCYSTGDISAQSTFIRNRANGIGVAKCINCFSTGTITSNGFEDTTRATAYGIGGKGDIKAGNGATNSLALNKNIISNNQAYKVANNAKGQNNYASRLVKIESKGENISDKEGYDSLGDHGNFWYYSMAEPINSWPDEAWDKSNNTILPQLKYTDGTLMPDQPRLLKSDYATETPSKPEQPASPSDATLKSLSYKIGDNGQVTPVPNFSPNVYQYEIGYRSNEEAIAAGEAPLYPDGTRVYPIGVTTNEKAQVLLSDMLLPYGFAKVGVTSEDKSTDRTYSLFMMSEKDAGNKYYIMMSLDHLTVQINGTTYRNGDIYKANHNEDVTVKLIPDQGYKLPNNMVIDYGSSISFLELDQTGEIKLGEISWHMDISVSAIKDEELEDNSFAYNGLKYQIISDNTVSLINLDTNYGSNWNGTTCTIPATVSYNGKTYNVTEIARSFYGFDLLKEIHIPASVTMIHSSDEMYDGALTGNKLLEKIIVDAANPVYTSENGILYDKNKTTLIICPAQYEAETLTLPTSLKRIESEAFMYCVNIRNLVLPEGLTHVFDAAFAPGSTDPAWQSITFPSTIKFLGDMLFDDLDRGLNIYCRSTNPANITLEDHPFADVDTASVLYVPKGCKAKYQAAEGWKEFKQIIEEGEDKPAISFTVDQLTYTVIGQNEVAISGVTDKTPTYYNIKQTVTYQNNVYKVTTVGKEAFKGCTNLVRFNPESIRMVIDSIGEMAFDGCSKLSSLIFSEGLETIGNYAFNGCTSLGAIDIPASVTHIGEGIFDNCSKLSQIRVKTANKHYSSSNGVLYNKDMTTLLIYPNMRGETYIIPQGVTQIENFAFYTCTNLKSVTLPEGLESIGEGAFDGCTGLKSLTLPASVKRIGLGMVDNCEKTLEEIHSLNSTPINLGDYPEYTFFYYSDKSDICKLYVPRGSKGVYSKAPGWKDFKQILEEGENPPLIPNKADEEIILNTDSTYTDSKGNICHFNGMVGNGEEETVINKLTIKGSATSTTATITFNQVAVGNGSNTGEATTNVTNNTNVTIELIGDNSLGKLVNNGITKLISKLNATLNNTVVVNNGTFVDETGLLTRVKGVAELDITAPTDQEVLPGENVTLTASAKVGVTYTITFVWEQLQLDGTWKTVGSPNIYTPVRSGLRSTTIVTDRLIVHSNDAGKYRCVIRNKVGEVSSTLTTSPITVTTKNSVDIITPKYNRKLTIYGNQLHFDICVPTEVYIINLNGSIFRKISLPAGDTYIDGLDKGIYILLFKDGQTEKVRI
ncbi:leucine-rich repeat protein [Parabacteroides goldsteinii]|uniref:leucine-rich repeat protein n=1 Tax=Parabacteroides goldsteinii TaxID=328812 RepID=UPI001D1CFBE7|nr:leucine-rich repeat protein [Parabacteroides goldsteinii]MBS6576520.1 leucine-rich repeat protein [Parabacteroides goldsteinii]